MMCSLFFYLIIVNYNKYSWLTKQKLTKFINEMQDRKEIIAYLCIDEENNDLGNSDYHGLQFPGPAFPPAEIHRRDGSDEEGAI